MQAVTTWNHSRRESEGQGYWLAPVNSSGVKTSEKTTLIRFGVTSVPITSPRLAPSRLPRISASTNSGTPLQCQGIEPSTRIPTGIMINVAITARVAANTTFSTATSPVAIGASSRSSISFVHPNSTTSGKASACILVITVVSASSPGNSRCA